MSMDARFGAYLRFQDHRHAQTFATAFKKAHPRRPVTVLGLRAFTEDHARAVNVARASGIHRFEVLA